MRLISLFLLSFLASAAHAKLTLHCVAEIYGSGEQKEWSATNPIQEPLDTMKFEIAEVDLNFQPGLAKNEFEAKGHVEFKLFPGLVTHVTVYEMMNGNSVQWASHLSLAEKASGNVLARNSHWVELKDGSETKAVICEAYDKTEKPGKFVEPTEPREILRGKYLYGYAPFREYIRNFEHAMEWVQFSQVELYDFFHQLMRISGRYGTMFRKFMNDRLQEGFQFRTLTTHDFVGDYLTGQFGSEQKNVDCQQPPLKSFKCDLESFEVKFSFFRAPTGDQTKIHRELRVIVTGVIFRESESRLIRGYSIRSFTPVLEKFEGGGGSSSSGGRINGGN